MKMTWALGIMLAGCSVTTTSEDKAPEDAGIDSKVVDAAVASSDGGDSAPVPPYEESKDLPFPWSQFCWARVTQDIYSSYDEVTLKKGHQYLLESWGEYDAYLVAPRGGKVLASIRLEPDTGYPFVSNCEIGKTTNHIAVFADFDLFEDRTLQRPLCSLTRGTHFPVSGWSIGGERVGDGVDRTDATEWPAPCDGHSEVYFEKTGDGYPFYHVLVPAP